jgi:hypothetical protein
MLSLCCERRGCADKIFTTSEVLDIHMRDVHGIYPTVKAATPEPSEAGALPVADVLQYAMALKTVRANLVEARATLNTTTKAANDAQRQVEYLELAEQALSNLTGDGAPDPDEQERIGKTYPCKRCDKPVAYYSKRCELTWRHVPSGNQACVGGIRCYAEPLLPE